MDKNIVWNIYGSKQAVLDLNIQLRNDYLDYVRDFKHKEIQESL